ncbi:hypothetical protein [Phenylobacterium sp.]|uniref:hypothetical protein n=1 Tax=Phenylobacterium sp. TaxID=1871053 RepID=UPI00120F1BD1|nr:hypothetical protein [Phenylobacterium sp.]THD57459.1 MAG: hypothetical protein E8A49_22710 [Phenylobacterium sp.]
MSLVSGAVFYSMLAGLIAVVLALLLHRKILRTILISVGVEAVAIIGLVITHISGNMHLPQVVGLALLGPVVGVIAGGARLAPAPDPSAIRTRSVAPNPLIRGATEPSEQGFMQWLNENDYVDIQPDQMPALRAEYYAQFKVPPAG